MADGLGRVAHINQHIFKLRFRARVQRSTLNFLVTTCFVALLAAAILMPEDSTDEGEDKALLGPEAHAVLGYRTERVLADVSSSAVDTNGNG